MIRAWRRRLFETRVCGVAKSRTVEKIDGRSQVLSTAISQRSLARGGSRRTRPVRSSGQDSDFLGLALLALLHRLALLGTEQLLLQVAERFGQLRPVAGEVVLGAFDPTNFGRRGSH